MNRETHCISILNGCKCEKPGRKVSNVNICFYTNILLSSLQIGFKDTITVTSTCTEMQCLAYVWKTECLSHPLFRYGREKNTTPEP